MTNRRNFIKKTSLGITYISLSNPIELLSSQSKETEIKYCRQSPRNIPVIADVDIAVIGGSSGAVAAAGEASRSGVSVFLVSNEPYLGIDICGHYQLWLNVDEIPTVDLAKRIFKGGNIPTPMLVKSALDNELIDNDIRFLFSSHVTDLIINERKEPSGIIISNRSGRQAIKAKVIIDATETAMVAKIAGAEFTEFKPGKYPFRFVVIGNKPGEYPDTDIRELPSPVIFRDNVFKAYEYTFNLMMNDLSYQSFMKIENIIRDKTWDPDQVGSSDCVLMQFPLHIAGKESFKGDQKNISKIPKNCLIPKNINNIYVSGSCADIPGELARVITRPVSAMELGCMTGRLAAEDAKLVRTGQRFQVLVEEENPVAFTGEIKELLTPLRESQKTVMIPSDKTFIPVFGNFDVVIMGGGTAGASAAIAASRNGAKTLVLEYLHGLGGIGTMGLIGLYFFGNRKGFTAELDKAVTSMAPADHHRQFNKADLVSWDNEPVGVHYLSDWKSECYRREIRKAGGEIWFGVLGTGAYTEGNMVKGVVISSPQGRGVVLAKIVIDSTGSADIAIAAGSDYEYTSKSELAVQGGGLPKKDPGDHFFNSDWTFINDNDVLDVTRIFVEGKVKYPENWDLGQLPQTRERRRIKGRYYVSVYDIINKKCYPDTISHHISAFDTHGYTVDPYFTLRFPDEWRVVHEADVPLRTLLPEKLDGIMVTGLGVSASRDAMPVIRMQACLQNQGYAVGYLSAVAVKEDKRITDVDIKKVQRHLVELGSLPERVLTDTEEPEYTDQQLKDAAIKVTDNFDGLAILLSKPEKSVRLLEERLYTPSDNSAKLVYSSILGILGSKAGWRNLVQEIEKYSEWDKGWNFRVMGNQGPDMSRLDSLIMALGRTREKAALPYILAKAEILKPDGYFSHFRSVSLACEYISNPAAVPVLRKLLNFPGLQNNAIKDFREARGKVVPGATDTSVRSRELREIYLARALYRCGDFEGLGRKILTSYATGLQGHYYLHSYSILKDDHLM